MAVEDMSGGGIALDPVLKNLVNYKAFQEKSGYLTTERAGYTCPNEVGKNKNCTCAFKVKTVYLCS